MFPFAMLCKSYSGDFEYAKRMVKSFNEFNTDEITLFIVVPELDLDLFESLDGAQVEVLSEGLLAQYLVDHEVHGIRPGYINQEIIKLSFWELEFAENYFCVDSDAEFIRRFSIADFMFDPETPYSVLVQDLELQVEPEYHKQYWISRESELRSIAEIVGLDPRVILTCHGHTVFSSKVLRSFVRDFLQPRDWSYADALEFSPYEFTWYNMWLQKSGTVGVHPREPWMKVFHNQSQHIEYLLRGIEVEDISRGYLGIVVNSNYSRRVGLVDAQISPAEAFARYLSFRQIFSALWGKLFAAIPMKFNPRKNI
jgi:hypothetical protein